MRVNSSVVFADLTGSTGVFEALGNEKATQAITRLTQLIGETCVLHGGRVVKNLGDGVLALFPEPDAALRAVVQLQRDHNTRIQNWPPKLRMQLRVGVAVGPVVEVDGDTFGDPVNLAARLSDLCGDAEIWFSGMGRSELDVPPGARLRSLGPVAIRGLSEPREVLQIEWQDNEPTDMLTVPAPLGMPAPRADPLLGHIELNWLDVHAAFTSGQMPIHLGRHAEFAVSDQRVSRQHARIDWTNNNFVLTDLSSYGTWVRFGSGDSEIALRRQYCVLVGEGEIALGAPFTDFSAPIVRFQLGRSGVTLTHQRR